MELKNRHVAVTGASRGIGRAFAMMCAREQATLYVVSRKVEEDLIQELKTAGAKDVIALPGDLTQLSEITRISDSLKAYPIDILFNNAGALTGGLIECQSLAEIHSMLQVNVYALIHLTHQLLPGMMERKRGKIINNSSVSAYMHFPCASTYAASKAAVAAFTDCIRQELKGTGVSTLLLITPGIKTQMFDDIDKLYGQNISVPKSSISSTKYAEIIREAILEDLEVLEPEGLTGIGLKVAKLLPRVFESQVQKGFRRTK
ncbi:MAG: SDR family NAD(P)-dependent oxidoreductase [Bdellovibrionia bacterium]